MTTDGTPCTALLVAMDFRFETAVHEVMQEFGLTAAEAAFAAFDAIADVWELNAQAGRRQPHWVWGPLRVWLTLCFAGRAARM